MFLRNSQSLKAPFPILVTPSGITMEVMHSSFTPVTVFASSLSFSPFFWAAAFRLAIFSSAMRFVSAIYCRISFRISFSEVFKPESLKRITSWNVLFFGRFRMIFRSSESFTSSSAIRQMARWKSSLSRNNFTRVKKGLLSDEPDCGGIVLSKSSVMVFSQ